MIDLIDHLEINIQILNTLCILFEKYGGDLLTSFPRVLLN